MPKLCYQSLAVHTKTELLMVKLTFILAKNVREYEGKYLVNPERTYTVSEQGGGSKCRLAKTSLNFL